MKTRMYCILPPLLLFILVLPTIGLTQKSPLEELKTTQEAWYATINSGDIDKIVSFWSEDVVIYLPDRPVVRGREAMESIVRQNREVRNMAPKLHVDEIHVADSGEMGYTIGRYIFMNMDENTEGEKFPGRYLCLWRKESDGSWKCYFEIHNPTSSLKESYVLPSSKD